MVTYPVPFCRITVYESANRFYLVGSDVNDTRFCLLKIDRTETRDLLFSNGDHEYTRKELNELLAMIHGGNASSASKSSSSAATYVLTERVANAKGILGFVRFMEGYYMIVITKSSRVAQLGMHFIYKIEETEMIYIPAKIDSQQSNAEEQRYVKLFQSVDMATNFYFSYTYDLTRTLQDNISRPDRTDLCEKYVWNSYLLEPMIGERVNARWILPVVHGFLGTCSLSIKGFTFNLLLLARRSNKFAGTRFLKRGANNKGYVANEVETEQIVYDASISSFLRGRFTSFVQLRGSVPLVWSQDLTKVVGKPPIQLDAVDPFAVIPALHFQDLRTRYNDPIIVINLMKRREKRQQESVLSDEFRSSISYLNQFLDPREAILYLSFDMARCHKTGSVLPKLEEIAYNVLKLNGWFQTFAPLYFHQLQASDDAEEVNLRSSGRFILQNGVPRTNCVDCLDRTNVGQFIIGKVALSYQLYALGLLNEPRLALDTEICRLLETLYEQHGDTLALQYAGSQLVHSIRTYKKISLFQERSRDVIQTLSRYYSNTFNDHDKQHAINLFLGIFRPSIFRQHLWELYSDLALHNPYIDIGVSEVDYCAWYELPVDYWQSRIIARDLKEPLDVTEILKKDESEWQLTDFDRYYRTFELTSMDALVIKEQREMVHIDSPTSPPTVSTQPFLRLWKKQESNGSRMQRRRSQDSKKGARKQRTTRAGDEENDQEETSSEEEEAEAHSDTEIQYSTPWYGTRVDDKTGFEVDLELKSNANKARPTGDTANFLLTSMSSVYGTEIHHPSKKDLLKYERCVELGLAYHQEAGEEETERNTSLSKEDESILQRRRKAHVKAESRFLPVRNVSGWNARMLASTIREDDQISLVSSSASSDTGHRGHRIMGPTVFAGCLPSFGGHNETATTGVGDRRGRKASNKGSTFYCAGVDSHATDDGPHCSSKIDEMSPSLACRTTTLPTSATEPQLSDFGSKVPMDFSHTTGKIINDPDEVVAMLKEGHWRAKDQVRFHSPDNRLPHLSSYLIQPWFHGELSRDEAVSMIGAHGNKEGTFLIRLSRSLPGCFVLSLWHGGSVLHYPITQVKDQSGDKFLSLDSGRTKFMDLLQLVEFYQVNAGNCLPTTLRHFVTRAVDVPRYANPSTPRSSF